MNILALLAHPDDVEYGCAGTLLKYKAAGHKIFIALTTSGNTGSNEIGSREEIQNIREAEARAAAAYLDGEIMFLRFEDEGLLNTPQTRRAVLTAIRWADPDVIFTHHPADYSTDHNITSRLVTDVLLSVGGNLHDADLPPIEKQPHVFFIDGTRALVDISDYMETRKAMLCCHKSQQAWMGEFHPDEEFVQHIVDDARMKGIWGGYRYAEAFDAHQILGYCADYRLLP